MIVPKTSASTALIYGSSCVGLTNLCTLKTVPKMPPDCTVLN
jgi:hypothetical protein